MMAGMALLLGASTARGETLAEYHWDHLVTSNRPLGGEITQTKGRSVLRFVGTNGTPSHLRVLEIANPPVGRGKYAITGEIRYEGVQGQGYLEMWSCFAPNDVGMPETRFFSRTLGETGEMASLRGSSGWRTFLLPFDPAGAAGPPFRLEVNLFLPGQGSVDLGPLKLIRQGAFGSQVAAPGAWWSDRAGGFLGGVGGTLFGGLAGLMGWLAARGRARGFVIGTAYALIGIGAICTVAGGVALWLRQPYGVWFTLLLLGVLLLGILSFRVRDFQRQYANLELRRMASMDT
jgi:hypothetical protein